MMKSKEWLTPLLWGLSTGMSFTNWQFGGSFVVFFVVMGLNAIGAGLYFSRRGK